MLSLPYSLSYISCGYSDAFTAGLTTLIEARLGTGVLARLLVGLLVITSITDRRLDS